MWMFCCSKNFVRWKQSQTFWLILYSAGCDCLYVVQKWDPRPSTKVLGWQNNIMGFSLLLVETNPKSISKQIALANNRELVIKNITLYDQKHLLSTKHKIFLILFLIINSGLSKFMIYHIASPEQRVKRRFEEIIWMDGH